MLPIESLFQLQAPFMDALWGDGPRFAISPLVIAGGAALLKGLGGFFSGRSKAKKEDAAAKETQRANVATHAQNEQRRIAALKSILAAGGARGINVPVDPSVMEARPYTGADPTKVAGAGRGSALLGGLLGGAGGLAQDYVQATQLMSPGQPTGGLPGFDPETIAEIAAQEGVSTEEVADLVREMLADRVKKG